MSVSKVVCLEGLRLSVQTMVRHVLLHSVLLRPLRPMAPFYLRWEFAGVLPIGGLLRQV